MMVLLFLMVLILCPGTKNISLESVDRLVPISLEEN
jgi:hypothetical protein